MNAAPGKAEAAVGASMVYLKKWMAGRFQRQFEVLGGQRCRICQALLPSAGTGLCDRADCQDEAALLQAFNGI